jgi:hypothetical protein
MPTPKEAKMSPQYCLDKARILNLMAQGKEGVMVEKAVLPVIMEELRTAGWGIVRMGENFEGGFYMAGK